MKKQILKLQSILIFTAILWFQPSFSQLTPIDIFTGPSSSFAKDFEAVGSSIFFAAIDVSGDDEPHIFDPMLGPTAMKIDVNPSGSSIPAEFTNVGGDVFFSAEDASGDRELYLFDSMGMLTKIDVDPAGSSMPFRLTNIDGILFFTAEVSGDKEAYYLSGTTPIKIDTDPAGSGDPEEYTFAGGFTFFVATVAGDEELYKFDGVTLTKVDINPSASSDPNELTAVGDNLYFNAEGTTGDKELFVYDTMTSTATEIEVSASGSSSPFALYNGDGVLYFTAMDAGDVEMYEYDPGSSMLSKIDINPSGSSFPAIFPGNYMKVGSDIFVPAEVSGDRELYKFDTGTGMVTKIDVNPSGPSAPLELVEMAGKLYFTAEEGLTDKELYSYDGTLSKIELNAGGSGDPIGLTVTDSPALYLNGTDGAIGFELFEYLDPTLSTEDLSTIAAVSLFPNPIRNSENLILSVPTNSFIETITIHSMNGSLIETFHHKKATDQIEIPIQNYPSGLYIVTIKTPIEVITKKLIIN